MYNKTTSPLFNKYGSIISLGNFIDLSFYKQDIKELNQDVVNEVFYCEAPVLIEVISGITLLLNKTELDGELDKFVIHRIIKVNANTYFNLLSITPNSTYRIYYPRSVELKTLKLNKPYVQQHIRNSFNLKEIYSYYYNVKQSNYHFKGEKHSFYELTYVDNGSLNNVIDKEDTYQLDEYELMIFGHNQFHEQYIDNDKPCSYFTINFDLDITCPELLLNQKFIVTRDILNKLNDFVRESENDVPFKEDLMINILNQVLILLMQSHYRNETKPTSPVNQHYENELLDKITNYINNNLFEPLTIDDLCNEFSISRSSLQNLFKDNLKIAPKQYINEVKLAKSRMLIKENKHTVSNIALMLGFSSIHYFSRKFTQHYKITPTDYAKSIYDTKKD